MVVHWIHALGAVAWIGGSAFFALVLRPAMAADPEGMRRVMRHISGPYRELVDISIIAIVITGLIMMFERLTGGDAGIAYFIVLALKLTLAAWMFYLVWSLRRAGFRPERYAGWRRRLSSLLGYNALLALGILIFLLAEVLRALFESAVSG